MTARLFLSALIAILALGACGGGGDDDDPWADFDNTEWEGFPLKQEERKLPTIPGPTFPQGIAGDDPAFFPYGMLSPQYQPPQRMADLGFTHAVPMLNATMVYPRDDGYTALIELRAIRLICQDPKTLVETLRVEVRVGAGQAGQQGLKWETYNRGPRWFTSGVASTKVNPSWSAIAGVVNLRANPTGIYHAWLDPRIEAPRGHPCVVEVDARITGDARLQVGLDYWKGPWSDYNHYSDGCITSNNCQAYLGLWHGDTGGVFRTIRAPVRF